MGVAPDEADFVKVKDMLKAHATEELAREIKRTRKVFFGVAATVETDEYSDDAGKYNARDYRDGSKLEAQIKFHEDSLRKHFGKQ